MLCLIAIPLGIYVLFDILNDSAGLLERMVFSANGGFGQWREGRRLRRQAAQIASLTWPRLAEGPFESYCRAWFHQAGWQVEPYFVALDQDPAGAPCHFLARRGTTSLAVRCLASGHLAHAGRLAALVGAGRDLGATDLLAICQNAAAATMSEGVRVVPVSALRDYA